MDQLLLWLAVIFIGGRLGGEVAQRAGQPAVVGEILAGILLGRPCWAGFLLTTTPSSPSPSWE